MRKREEREKEKGLEFRNIDFLQKKYRQEKEILQKEVRRLDDQLSHEISRSNSLQIELQTQKNSYQSQIQRLKRQCQQLSGKLADYHQGQGQRSLLQQSQYLENLRKQKKTVTQLIELRDQNQELQRVLFLQHHQINKLKEENEQRQIQQKQFNRQIDEMKSMHYDYKRESKQQMEAIIVEKQNLKEECSILGNKLSDQKKKKKELDKKVEDMEKKIRQIETNKQEKNQQQIVILKNEKDKLHEKNVQSTTRMQLLQINLQQKQQYIQRIEAINHDYEKKTHQQTQEITQVSLKLQKSQNDYRRLHNEHEHLKNRSKQQLQEAAKTIQQSIQEMRRKMAQDMISLLKDKDQQRCQRSLEKYMNGLSLRNCKSQSSFPEQLINKNRASSTNNQNELIDRIRLENQIGSLEIQLAQSKKQTDIANMELGKIRRLNQQRRIDLQNRERQITELRLRLERIENDKNKQILGLRSENSMLKGRETQKLQLIRDKQQYQQAISLKLAFYERKIKEHLETIERKDHMIQKLKINRCQSDQKIRVYEDSLRRQIDQNELLKKYKQDCQRKDELAKDYKTRLQKCKIQIEDLRSEVDQLRKDKIKLQKLVQSKQNYIISLKNKHQKQKNQLQNEKPQGKDVTNKMKEMKSSYEQKLKKVKKDQQELYVILNQIKQIIMSKVDEYVAKNIPATRKKNHQYEAAKLLGLKPTQLEDFLNPGIGMDRTIGTQLDTLWEEGNYGQFIQKFIGYISVKK